MLLRRMLLLGARREELPTLLPLFLETSSSRSLWVSRSPWASLQASTACCFAAVSSVLAGGPFTVRSNLDVALHLSPACACSNEDVVSICNKLASKSCDDIAAELSAQAVAKGSTDDVTTLVRECLNAVLCCAVLCPAALLRWSAGGACHGATSALGKACTERKRGWLGGRAVGHCIAARPRCLKTWQGVLW